MKKKFNIQQHLLLLLISVLMLFTNGCKKEEAPTITTSSVSSITATRGTSGGVISLDGGSAITASGLCWSTAPIPTISDFKTTDGTTSGSFTSSITGLALNTTYYVRAYATNSIGTGYGDVISFTTTSVLSVGDSYQGGVIAYILDSNDPGYDSNMLHGLIVAPSDQSSSIRWFNGTYTTTGASGTAYGTGNSNTNTIITSQGTGTYAAKLCSSLVLNGYSDWYLPSSVELNILYANKVILGGFNSALYWSSSEYDNYFAAQQDFRSGTQDSGSKEYTRAVRAVRTF